MPARSPPAPQELPRQQSPHQEDAGKTPRRCPAWWAFAYERAAVDLPRQTRAVPDRLAARDRSVEDGRSRGASPSPWGPLQEVTPHASDTASPTTLNPAPSAFNGPFGPSPQVIRGRNPLATEPSSRMPPAGLEEAGAALWREVRRDYALRPDEEVNLVSACRMLDELRRFEAKLAGASSLTVSGSRDRAPAPAQCRGPVAPARAPPAARFARHRRGRGRRPHARPDAVAGYTPRLQDVRGVKSLEEIDGMTSRPAPCLC